MRLTVVFLFLMLLFLFRTNAQSPNLNHDNRFGRDSITAGYKIARHYQKKVHGFSKRFFTKNNKASWLMHFSKNRNQHILYFRQGSEDTVDIYLNGSIKQSIHLETDGHGASMDDECVLAPLMDLVNGNYVTLKFRKSKLFIRLEINRKYDFTVLYINYRYKLLYANLWIISKRFPLVSM